MHYIKPHRKLLYVWQLRALISALVPAIFVSLFFTPFGHTWNLLTGTYVVGYAALIAVYLPLRFLSTSYRMDTRTVEINRGVLYLVSKTVLLENVEFVTLQSFPDERMFGLSSISLFVVGGRVVLAGLTADHTRVLADYLPGGHLSGLPVEDGDLPADDTEPGGA